MFSDELTFSQSEDECPLPPSIFLLFYISTDEGDARFVARAQ